LIQEALFETGSVCEVTWHWKPLITWCWCYQAPSEGGGRGEAPQRPPAIGFPKSLVYTWRNIINELGCIIIFCSSNIATQDDTIQSA